MRDIAVCVALSEAQQHRLAAGVGARTVGFPDPDALCQSPIIFGNHDARVVSGNLNLRRMQSEPVGVAEYAGLDWRRRQGKARLTNLAGFFADPVAETALAGNLAFGRGLHQLIPLRDRAEWVGGPIRSGPRPTRS